MCYKKRGGGSVEGSVNYGKSNELLEVSDGGSGKVHVLLGGKKNYVFELFWSLNL